MNFVLATYLMTNVVALCQLSTNLPALRQTLTKGGLKRIVVLTTVVIIISHCNNDVLKHMQFIFMA